jgi:hypothetical protein
MTFRGGEKYSLIKYENITGATPNSPFIKFTSDFIAIDTLGLLQDPALGTITSQHFYDNQDAIAYLDSLHDFKNFFSDCEANIKGIKEMKRFQKFGFTFLLNGGYPTLYGSNLGMEILKGMVSGAGGYSYLNRIPRPLNQNNLENYFSIGNIYKVITQNQNDVWILPNVKELSTVIDASRIIGQIAEIFGNYIDPNFGGKIKLICDMQLSMFNNIRLARAYGANLIDSFCILYTAETFSDPAPVTTLQNLTEIFGSENIYFEQLSSSESRTHNVINGNVSVTFQNVQIDSRSKRMSTDVTYRHISGREEFYPIQANTSNKNPNSIAFVEKDIETHIYKAPAPSDNSDIYNFDLQRDNTRWNFYKDFLDDINTGIKDDYSVKLSMKYARKRLGDALQGDICKIEKLQNVQFINLFDRSGVRASNDAVLLTHDRMLFSKTICDNKPVILDLGTHIILNVPRSVPLQVSSLPPVPPAISTTPVPPPPVPASFFGGNDIQKGGSFIDNYFYYPDFIINFLPHFGVSIRSNSTLNKLQKFISIIKDNLADRRIIYKYYSSFYYDILCFGSESEIERRIEEEYSNIDKGGYDLKSKEGKELLQNRLLLYVGIDSSNYLSVNILDGESGLGFLKGKVDGEDFSQTDITKDKINSYLSGNMQNTLYSIIDFIYGNIEDYREEIIDYGESSTGGGNNINSSIVFAIILHTLVGQKSTEEEYTCAKVLSSPFEILNSKEMLVENNINIIYYLFDLLKQYEKSFIFYKEGKEAFYIKIDEGLEYDLPGNYFPNYIEFYVFMKLMLDDYDETKLRTINYAIFEYYLYSMKSKNSIYYKYQNIKSYTLNEDEYYISLEESQEVLIDEQTRIYFDSICERTIKISNEIYKEYFDLINKYDYKSIYDIISQNYLSETGFIEMGNIFVIKTVQIIESMLEKGLLKQYLKEAKQVEKEYMESNDEENERKDLSHIEPTADVYFEKKSVMPSYKPDMSNKFTSIAASAAAAAAGGGLKRKSIKNRKHKRISKKKNKIHKKKTIKNKKNKKHNKSRRRRYIKK